MINPHYKPFGFFRFGLAFMVAMSHSGNLGPAWFERMIQPWGLGNMAVMTFFVLSGYIIAEAIEVFYRDRPVAFIGNRYLRILPPYFAALLVSVLVHALLAHYGWLGHVVNWTPEAFSATNLTANSLLLVILYGLGRMGFQPDYFFVTNTWAVMVEVHFYLVVFGLMLLWPRLNRHLTEVGRRRIIMVGVVALCVLGPLAMFLKIPQLVYVSWAPFLLAGVLLYQLHQRQDAFFLAACVLSQISLLGTFCLYVGRNASALIAGPAVVLGLLIVILAFLGRARIPASQVGWDRFFGNLSYPLYINHWTVFVVYGAVASTGRGWGLWMAGMASAVGLSLLMQAAVEPLLHRVRDRLRGTSL
ncbi:MAG: acyltransferase [Verrucomicrobiae bacterium]|nr:acyltransferase [Verrucomicrobiae bacterium]